jgi:hypothetical protein
MISVYNTKIISEIRVREKTLNLFLFWGSLYILYLPFSWSQGTLPVHITTFSAIPGRALFTKYPFFSYFLLKN